jgi:hypothetical protein
MALPTNLTTNEVKDASGTEVEFTRLGVDASGRLKFYAASAAPNKPHEISIAHRFVGDGTSRRRQSVIRIEKTLVGDDIVGSSSKTIAQVTLDAPVGLEDDVSPFKDVLAELGSLVFTNASSTFLYDGTGNGAAALINGTL